MATLISGKYEVLSQLGAGGMGVVYKVRHTTLDRILALKTLPADLTENPDLIARFNREARVMARLQHNNIVRVIDFDFDGSFYYLVMEYIEGKTLKQLIHEKGALPLPEVLNIAYHTAAALAFAHNHTPPIVHRDIKPANIMIEETSGRIVVMDFGIAKELGPSELDQTQAGVIIGTVKYSPPEQLRHEALDGSADIYSLGMVMYELYTGQQFFAGMGETTVIGKVLYDSQENEPRFTNSTPQAFVDLITKTIAKERRRRYQRMEDFLRDLSSCQQIVAASIDATGVPPGAEDSTSIFVSSGPDQGREGNKKEENSEEQRRLAETAQVRAEEARQQAARMKAEENATTLFRQGLGQEERAKQNFREKNYAQAEEAYREAIRFFQRAGEEAAGTLALRKAESKVQPTIEPREQKVTEPESVSSQPAVHPSPNRPSWLFPGIAAVAVLAVVLLYLWWPSTSVPPQVAELPTEQSKSVTEEQTKPAETAPPQAVQPKSVTIANVQAAVAPFSCAHITVADVRNGVVNLEGNVESEAQRQEVRQKVSELSGVTGVQDTFAVVPRPFCEVITLLAPFQRRSTDGDAVRIQPHKGCDATYYRNEYLIVNVKARRPLHYVYVDYYVADKEAVAHLLPNPKQPNNRLDGASALTIGGTDSKAKWQIEPPFGMEMVTLISSSQPLWDQARPAAELVKPYLTKLEQALTADTTNGEIVTAYCFLTSVESR